MYDDDFFKDFMDEARMSPDVTLQIGYLPYHTPHMRLGMEVNSHANGFFDENDYYKMTLNTISLQDNFVFRVGTKNQKFGVLMKAGGGVVVLQEILDYFNDSENNKKDKTQYFGYFTAGGGLSIMYTPFRMLSMELGADFYNLFIPDMNIGILTPYVGIGVKF